MTRVEHFKCDRCDVLVEQPYAYFLQVDDWDGHLCLACRHRFWSEFMKKPMPGQIMGQKIDLTIGRVEPDRLGTAIK